MKNAFRAICFLIGALAFSACAQISPATRPHTHSGGSSGGSTLVPSSLTVTGSLTAPTIVGSTSVTSPILAINADWSIVPNGAQFQINNNFLAAGAFALVRADNSVNIAGTFGSSKACATGYSRVTPNYCRTNNPNANAWANAIACTTRIEGTNALPAGATAANITIEWNAVANNAIGDRGNTVTFYAVGGCTVPVVNDIFQVREFVATVAGTSIGLIRSHFIVPLTATNTVSTTQGNAGGNGNANITTIFFNGYFD